MTTTKAKSGKIRLKAAPESVPPHPASLELASSEMAPRQAVLLKAATIKDVAREASVAPMTVSYAFSGKRKIAAKTRQEVLRVAKELGYQPNLQAQRLSHGQSHDLVGMICPAFEVGTRPLKNKGVQQLLARHGLEVPLYAFDHEAEAPDFVPPKEQRVTTPLALLQRLRRLRPRAIMCNTGSLSSELVAELESCQQQGIVTVCYDHPLPAPLPCDSVLFDREDNTYQATRHLLDLGHKRVGLSLVGTSQPHDPYSSPRQQGFERALSEAGLTLSREWLQHGESSADQGELLAHWFLGLKERPTALCIVNETVASSFMHLIRRQGVRVPEDLSIVSHDDLPLARFAEVPLTTVSQPIDEIAGHAVEFLLSRLQGRYEGAPRQITARGTLIVRESTAAPSGA